MGGAVFLSAAQCAFNNELLNKVAANLPGVDPAMALGTGATQIRAVFTDAQLPIILDAYVDGLKAVWAICIAAFGIATVIGAFGNWKRIGAEDLKKAQGGAA